MAVGADICGTHDLIGQEILQHAVLVDAGFVGKSVGANDGFIRLDDDAGVVTDQLAGPADLRSVDACGKVVNVRAGAQRHHHLFEGGIAGVCSPMPLMVTSACRAPGNQPRQRVGGGQP